MDKQTPQQRKTMSSNGYEGYDGYGYYYAPSAQNYPTDPNQGWSEWSVEQEQYNHNGPVNHATNHSNAYVNTQRLQNFYGNQNRPYQRRFNNANQGFGGAQNWQWPNYKRPRPPEPPGEGAEPKSKAAKKRKKPLSQNVPSKKDWTLEEAEMALAVEKEYNKRHKNHSLIIKFPDLELNRDIVSKFHPSIENVHFQQPSTPRFCFVTLQENADADSVIAALNKIKFGEGFLTAEYKKDREEDQNIGPEDIDPCTLYVGNLAQEITKEDMVRTYPKGRRIDIGYAKKMKYTRYAFVSFKNVTESIEAFKNTHNTQMYSKSLIVRFRRLHGTVGLPGESKPQSPPKARTESTESANQAPESRVASEPVRTEPSTSEISTIHEPPVENGTTASEIDLTVVKKEVDSSDEEGGRGDYESPFLPGEINAALERHRPMIKKEIKKEVEEVEDVYIVSTNGVKVKTEPVVKKERPDEDDSSDDDSTGGIGDVNFSSLLNQLENHSNQIESLKKLFP